MNSSSSKYCSELIGKAQRQIIVCPYVFSNAANSVVTHKFQANQISHIEYLELLGNMMGFILPLIRSRSKLEDVYRSIRP